MASPAAASLVPVAEPVHYLPIATTLVSALFLVTITRRAARRRWPPHLTWWAVGVFFYGLGTAFETAITLGGNGPWLNRGWYIAGALLGGYPLATGTVYLLHRRRFAHAATGASLALVVAGCIAVVISPVDASGIAADPFRPSGRYLEWSWIRWLTPWINLYALLFLVGGAALSSVRWARRRGAAGRAAGTAAIALGALLPGIGGSMAKAGIVEGLYVGEFVGILLIWLGYELCVREAAREAAVAAPALDTGTAVSRG